MAFDVVVPAKMGQSAIGVTVTTIYTVPVGSMAILKEYLICNTTAGTINVDIHIVPDGSSATVDNAVMYSTPVVANGQLSFSGNTIMDAGDTIQVKATSLGLTITASGAEVKP